MPTPVWDEDDEGDWGDGDFHIMATTSAAKAAENTQPSAPSHISTEEAVIHYHEPIMYPVPKTGYYCVAVVPLTVTDEKRAETDMPNHGTYTGKVIFRNVFNGYLSAAEYPKINVGPNHSII